MDESINVPSLAEADRVARFVLSNELRQLAAKVAGGSADGLREYLALTIAVVGATEQVHRAIGKPNPSQWESLEASARTFLDRFVLEWLAEGDLALSRAVTQQRKRKLAARAGTLCLVETTGEQRTRWAVVTLPDDAQVPIAPEVGDGLAESVHDAEERLFEHLAAMPSDDALVFAGQIVGLLAASECLLGLLPSSEVAAFCVRLAAMSTAQA